MRINKLIKIIVLGILGVNLGIANATPASIYVQNSWTEKECREWAGCLIFHAGTVTLGPQGKIEVNAQTIVKYGLPLEDGLGGYKLDLNYCSMPGYPDGKELFSYISSTALIRYNINTGLIGASGDCLVGQMVGKDWIPILDYIPTWHDDTQTYTLEYMTLTDSMREKLYGRRSQANAGNLSNY